ncbi:MAG: ImmA/IrrE family metallo-endopeptidase [Gemmatimonadetes bacterium]|nr:ImmA/IrrE family metallo-endopeptidase [Gemmatimonadota bacterium]
MIQPPYFLPFTPRGRETELTAIRVKRTLHLGAYSSVDPFAILGRIPARLLTPADFAGCSRETIDSLFGARGNCVSAIGYGKSPATGEWLIWVNGSHHIHRQRASLIEEIVHILLDHPKTLLPVASRQPNSRTYDRVVEDEAYNVGAACIIPYRDLFYGIKERPETVEQIAGRYNVSSAYVRYRIKRAGLANVYKKSSRSPLIT